MSEKNKSGLFRKMLFATVTQISAMALAVITNIIMPNYLGAEYFGYFQVYIFYLGYANLCEFGFNDGIALYYGGYNYKELPFARIRRAVQIISIILISITLFALFGTFWISSPNSRFIYRFVFMIIPFMAINCITSTTLLSCGRTELYNLSQLAIKVLFTVTFLIMMRLSVKAYEPAILADFLSRIIVTLVLCFITGSLFVGPRDTWKEGWNELKEKSGAGIFIALSVLLSSFIPSFSRIVVQLEADIRSYGIYSFAHSLIGIVTIFVNTLGMVIYPVIKRLKEDMLSEYYILFSFFIKVIVYLFFLAYPLINIFIVRYMPEYANSLSYLPILMTICLPTSKMYMLVIPYCKTWRLEKKLFIASVIGLVMTVFVTGLSYFAFKSIYAVSIGAAISVFIWHGFSDWFCFRTVKAGMYLENMEEFFASVVYAIVYTRLSMSHAFIAFGIVFMAIAFFHRGKFLKLEQYRSML